jgi:hypothetical protein
VTRVTADSNIYISALLFGGPPDDILKLAEQAEIHLSISDAILDEVSRVLRDKFRLSAEELHGADAYRGDDGERKFDPDRRCGEGGPYQQSHPRMRAGGASRNIS